MLGLESQWEIWGKSDGVCRCCGCEKETLRHFLFICQTFADVRCEAFKGIEAKLIDSGFTDVWHHFIASSITSKLNMLIGDHGYLVNDTVGSIFDHYCKRFLGLGATP